MRFVLASASPRRRKMIAAVIKEFIAVSTDAEEADNDIYPHRLPLTNAALKAEAAAVIYPDDLVCGVDTVIEMNGKIIGKPQSREHAVEILQMLSGQTHLVISGVSLRSIKHKINCLFADTTEVKFKALNRSAINNYLDKVHVLDKAGAYAIQEYEEILIESVNGSRDNVIGLPCARLKESIAACGGNKLLIKNG